MGRIGLLVAFVLWVGVGMAQEPEIRNTIEKFRPTNGCRIPADIKFRLGATHVGGKYCLTEEPFIIEGAKKLNELGYGIIKLWFANGEGNPKGYMYHSDWKVTRQTTLKELAEHPYYRRCFDMPFSVFALSISDGFPGNSTKDLTVSLAKTEEDIYRLSLYLLQTYRDREITFIIQNWEGDWLLRGGTGPDAHWEINGAPADWKLRVENMCKWVNARQRGVDRARAEVKGGKCKVYHAVEANRVMDGRNGVPSVATHVLPGVEIDMVSWSAYDGVSEDGVKMYEGICFLKQNMRPTAEMNGKKVVFIGEIGYPENMANRTKEEVVRMWDTFMAVYLALDIPYVFHWELYCNELKADEFDRKQYPSRSAADMRGFWLIRPDGSKSWAQEFLESVLKGAGERYDRMGQ